MAILSAPSPARADLPPPPREAAASATVRLRLELVVNEAPTGEIVAVQRNGQHFLIDAADLRAARFPLPSDAAGLIDVTALSRVIVEYRQESQQLAFSVPVDWLPWQTLNGGGGVERVLPESSF